MYTFCVNSLAVPVLSDTGRPVLAVLHALPCHRLHQEQQDVFAPAETERQEEGNEIRKRRECQIQIPGTDKYTILEMHSVHTFNPFTVAMFNIVERLENTCNCYHSSHMEQLNICSFCHVGEHKGPA